MGTPNANQEAFDKMVSHIMGMSEPCWDEQASQCVYLRADGNRCPVGALLTEKEAASLGEMAIDDINWDVEEEIPSSLKGLNAELLMEMQTVHDKKSNWGSNGFQNWNAILKIAQTFHLDTSKVPNE